MKTTHLPAVLCALLAQPVHAADPVKVNALNFACAESDTNFARSVKIAGGIGKFAHIRTPAPIDKQDVMRMNRDTRCSAAIFDLDAGPVTITMPDAGQRFMSLLIVNEDHYAPHTLFMSIATLLSET